MLRVLRVSVARSDINGSPSGMNRPTWSAIIDDSPAPASRNSLSLCVS